MLLAHGRSSLISPKNILIISPGFCASLDPMPCQPTATAEDFPCRRLARAAWRDEAGHSNKPSCPSHTLIVCC